MAHKGRVPLAPSTILVVALCGVGDTLSFVPHLHRLRTEYPQARIDILARSSRVVEWLQSHRLCDAAHYIYDERYSLGGDNAWRRCRSIVAMLLRIRRARYDWAFWPYAQTTWKKMVLARWMGVRRTYLHRCGSRAERWFAPWLHLVHFRQTDAVIERNTALLAAAGVAVDRLTIAFPSTMADAARGRAILARCGVATNGKLIGFHPGGNIHWTPYRQWPAERFVDLADRLGAAFGGTALLFGTPEETPLLASIRQRMRHPAQIITDLPFAELVDAIAALDGLIGNESALVHLAGAAGIPSISLVGPTNYHQTGPWGPQTRVVRLDLPCSPCFETGFTAHCPHHLCMQALTVDRVFETIAALLRDRPAKPNERPEIISLSMETPTGAEWAQFLAERSRWREPYDGPAQN